MTETVLEIEPNDAPSTETTTKCPSCNSYLVTDGLSSGQQFRCANCYSFSRFGKTDRVNADRLAWRSFWLGLASIIFLTLTGIPAIYYGIRSLLRTRFVRSKRGDQFAAIVGISLGSFFGVFMGFVVFCTVLVVLLQIMTKSETTDPALVASQCERFFEFDHPSLKPIHAASSTDTQFVFDFSNDDDLSKQNLNVSLIHLRKSLQSSDAMMMTMVRRRRLHGRKKDTKSGSEVFEWSTNGQPLDVKRTVYTEKPSESDDEQSTMESSAEGSQNESEPKPAAGESAFLDTHHYYGYHKTNGAFYGVTLTHYPEESGWTESDVKEFFASIRFAAGG